MMKVVGIKRVLILVILIAINAGLAAASYLYVIPKNDKLERDLRSTRNQISSKRAEADRLRNEFDLIQQQKQYFENLQNAGFMSDQNRLVARKRIESIQQYSKVLRASYDVDSARVSETPTTSDIGYVVLNSPISVNVESYDDIDFYNFVYWMENGFPGHVAVNTVRLKRVYDLNDAAIRAIGGGSQTALMKGFVDLSWKTMVPKSQVAAEDEFGSEGF